MLDQLLELARIWSEATGRSRARLATIVVNRGSFFDLIERPGATCNVDTVERFLVFFRDGANWPGDRIPPAAAGLLANFTGIATDAASEQEDDMAAAALPSAKKTVPDFRRAGAEAR